GCDQSRQVPPRRGDGTKAARRPPLAAAAPPRALEGDQLAPCARGRTPLPRTPLRRVPGGPHVHGNRPPPGPCPPDRDTGLLRDAERTHLCTGGDVGSSSTLHTPTPRFGTLAPR